MVRACGRTRDLVDSEVLPVINGYRERAELPWPLIHALIAGRNITGASTFA